MTQTGTGVVARRQDNLTSDKLPLIPKSNRKDFFTPSDVWSTSDWTLEPDVRLPRNGVKRPRPINLGCSFGHPTICIPETK